MTTKAATRRGWSIRAALFGMIALATAPPIGIGLLQIRSAGNAGRDLLAGQLDQELDRVSAAMRVRWDHRMGELLLLADNGVSRTIVGETASPAPADSQFLHDLLVQTAGVQHVALVDHAGRVRLRLTSEHEAVPQDAAAQAREGDITVIVPITDSAGTPLGEARATLSLVSVLPVGASMSSSSPPVLSVFDAGGNTPLATPAFPPELLRDPTFSWGSRQWLVRRRAVTTPALTLLFAAPLDPFVTPFRQAAGTRTMALVLGSALSLLLAALLASRLGRSVERLALAAEAVAGGKLDVRITQNGTRELGRVASAFNAMTAALAETLRRLAHRESLAAVGEFATSLAHEIRNPLTAIRVDLQHLGKRAALQDTERAALDRALRQVQRLDGAVSGALDIARAGQVHLARVALAPVLRDAMVAAEPEMARQGARLEEDVTSDNSGSVLADASALHQVFLNLLLNAAQAVGTDGVVRVRVEAEPHETRVHVSDNGRGIAARDLARVFEPFYSTRPGGTGLGLAIARQIAAAHGGSLLVDSQEGAGTTFTLTLKSAV